MATSSNAVPDESEYRFVLPLILDYLTSILSRFSTWGPAARVSRQSQGFPEKNTGLDAGREGKSLA
jgi:hypothetical protein